MFSDLLTQSVVMLTPGVRMDRGEAVADWSNPVSTHLAPASVQPGGGDTDHANAEGVSAEWVVYLTPDVQVDLRARFELPDMEGQFVQTQAPQVWRPGLGLDHVRVLLRRRDG